LDTDSISIESEIDGDFEDVDSYTLESMEINVYGSEAGNEGARVANRRHHLPDCVEITHDQEAMVITLDFGICVRCKNPIPLERIMLIPQSNRCVNCA